ncbi:MAG TPA: alpha-L-fucosidase [Methylomirabilota bacterium]|nr:alpha-L-fucosidase [Methylomirabilota bacterium]
MKKSILFTLTVAMLALAATICSAGETKAQRDARMAWWREAKFGMFIHWGVYSVPAGYYNGKPVHGIGEWIMNSGKIPMAEYQTYAKEFNPVKFNAEEWVKIAKDAGQKYIVITAKHHDGFAMFDTKASQWGITHASPFGRDPLKELAAACNKEGIQLGFYYSQAQDWNNGGAATHGKWDPAQQHDMDDYIDKIAVPQVKELLSNYGKFPVVFWWDTPTGMNPERAQKLYDVVEKLKPNIIMNNRLLGGGFTNRSAGGLNGDTQTPEQFIPPQGYPGRDWETCMTMNDTWGYKRDDQNFKSTGTFIRNLCDIASKGGNYLLNVGPNSEGEIPQPEVDRLKEVGAWMKVNGEAIYGTSPTIFGAEDGSFSATEKDNKGNPKFITSWDWRCTTKPGGNFLHFFKQPGKLYIEIFNWPAGQMQLPAVKGKITKAYLLADAKHSALKFQQTAQGVTIQLPEKAPDAIASVLCLKVKGEVATSMADKTP